MGASAAPDCTTLAPTAYERSAQVDEPSELAAILESIAYCSEHQQLRRPTPAELESWMMRIGDEPRALEFIASHWQGYNRWAVAQQLILSIPEDQRSARGWVTLAQTTDAMIDRNVPMDEAALQQSRQALQAWQQAIEGDAPLPPHYRMEIAQLHARLGEADQAIDWSEQVLGEMLQGQGYAAMPPPVQAGLLYSAAEVYVALRQPELAAAYMDQADSMVSDPDTLAGHTARRRWVETHLPIFLGIAEPQ